MRLFTCLVSASTACALACGSVSSTFTPLPDAGAPPDALGTDAAIDASVPDATPPPPPPGVARELTVVGGAVSDSRFRFQVEITGGLAGGSVRDATHQFDHALTVTLPEGAP